jgi:Cu(I)/Ag(I) efflux system membrane fusion protein
VLEQNAYKGAYVNTGETIFTIANPRYLWAKLDAYESDFAWLRLGQQAEFETDSYPGRTFKGKVTYLDPFFQKETRTFKVGVLYMDSKIELKPNMLVRGVIHARMTADGVGRPGKNTKENAPLVIPESAPLITGKRAIVYIEAPGKPGTFVAREVTLGPRTKGYYVVRHGLHEGEKVVVNGNFKIDSAVQILAKPSMMEHTGGEAMTMQHQHGQTPAMDMEMKMAPKSDGPRKGQQHEMYRGRD